MPPPPLSTSSPAPPVSASPRAPPVIASRPVLPITVPFTLSDTVMALATSRRRVTVPKVSATTRPAAPTAEVSRSRALRPP